MYGIKVQSSFEYYAQAGHERSIYVYVCVCVRDVDVEDDVNSAEFVTATTDAKGGWCGGSRYPDFPE